VPLLAGGVLELPLGVLAGEGRWRRLAVLGGGLLFIATLLGVASARSFAVLLAAFVAFYPASGAFVSLTQADLMDLWPERQAKVMARWELAGMAGAVGGPLLLTAVLAAGGGWRASYVTLAVLAAAAWLGMALRRPGAAAPSAIETGDEIGDERGWRERAREVLGALRDWGTLRWLLLIEVADLLVDVFTGFLGLYLVDVVHLSPPVAAVGIAIRLGAALAADAVLVVVLERVADLTVLRVSAFGALVLYPAFLLVPGAVAKLIVLALLSASSVAWYPLLQARLYGSLPGRSSVAVTLGSAASLAGGLGPLAVGIAAQAFGLSRALAGLVAVPIVILLVTWRVRGRAEEEVSDEQDDCDPE
jgi:MFS transporter, FSR family, fosmidomycin resistance protein